MDLYTRIGHELNDLEKTVQLALEAWQGAQQFPHQQRHFLNSLALNFHSFYNGLERIFELIARRLDPSFPSGEHWHRDLLKQMGQEFSGVRPPVLSNETIDSVDEFLAFRHRVRNLYTFNLEINRLQELLERLPTAWNNAKSDIENFQDLLRLAATDDD